MATNIRTGFVTGSGAVLDTLSSVTVADTRIRTIAYYRCRNISYYR